MPISAEDQKKVDIIMTEARGLWRALLSSNPPASIAASFQKKVEFDKLSEPEKIALFTVIVELRKVANAAQAAAGSAPAAAPAPAPKGGRAKPEGKAEPAAKAAEEPPKPAA